MNVTGDLPQIIQNFTANQLPGIIQKLTDAGATDEAAALTGFHQTISDGITQAGTVIAQDLAPVVEAMKDFTATLATGIGIMQGIVDNGIPLTATLGGKRTVRVPGTSGPAPLGDTGIRAGTQL